MILKNFVWIQNKEWLIGKFVVLIVLGFGNVFSLLVVTFLVMMFCLSVIFSV